MWPVMSVVITGVFRQQRSQMFMILELAKWNISITNYSRQVSGRNVIVSRKGDLILYSTPLRNKPHNHIHVLVC